MKTLFIISAALVMAVTAVAKVQVNTYTYVVKFNSECCGVPDAAPMLKCIASFKKKNKIKTLSYFMVSPMGREGEYYMAFPLTELNEKQKALFIRQIDCTTKNMKDKGNCSTEQNMVLDTSTLSSRTTIIKKSI